jgi:ketosteroid isomerase-like protein
MASRAVQALFIVAVVITTVSPIAAQEFSVAQKEVWQMEEMYWTDLKDSNIAHYMTLWHENFLGWPRDRDLPVGKDGLEDGARKKMAAGRVSSYEILSKAVSVVGNVGTTQYAVKVVRTMNNGTHETYTSRVTHTWLKTGSSWQIVGGMSAPSESSGHTW